MNFFALFSIVYFSNVSLKSETGINCSGKEIVHTAVEIFPAFYLHKKRSTFFGCENAKAVPRKDAIASPHCNHMCN